MNRWTRVALAACVSLGGCIPALANDLITIGTLPANTEEINVLAESAHVNVVRAATGSTINIVTNCPRNWNVKENTVRQAGFVKPRNGVEMLADALGSRAVVNGKVYLFPSGPIRGISMGKDGVKVGDKSVDPVPGSETAGGCKGGETQDIVEIQVPPTYKGNLTIGLARDSAAKIDGWTGGALSCTMMGTSALTAGNLKSLAKTVVDVRGDGKADISDVSTKVLVANVAGNGKVNIAHGTADVSNATVSGGGAIVMKGKFGDLKKVVEGGKGTIQISE
jgi:hypothetical protein